MADKLVFPATVEDGVDNGGDKVRDNLNYLLEQVQSIADKFETASTTLATLNSSALQFKTKSGGFNDLTASGIYVVSDGAPGGTSSSTHGLLLVFSRSSTSATCTQLWADNNLWLRNNNAGTWTSWVKVG